MQSAKNTQSQSPSPDQKLQIAQASVRHLNKYLDEGRHLRLMVLLWSKFSPKSVQLINSIPVAIQPMFYYMNIDNPATRLLLSKSRSMRIQSVPSIIVIEEDNTNTLYEADRIGVLLKNIDTILSALANKASQPQQPTQSQPSVQSGDQITPISSLKHVVYPEIPPEIEGDDERHLPHRAVTSRSRVKNASRPMDLPIIARLPEDTPRRGKRSRRARPPPNENEFGDLNDMLDEEVVNNNPLDIISSARPVPENMTSGTASTVRRTPAIDMKSVMAREAKQRDEDQAQEQKLLKDRDAVAQQSHSESESDSE